MDNRILKSGKTVYMAFSTDIIHGGHISIIKKASELGRVIAGVLSDEAIASYKRYPLLDYCERKEVINNVNGISEVVIQESISYRDNLIKLKPDYVVHGDDWQNGIQKEIRNEVISILKSYGGQLIEFPSSNDLKYRKIESSIRNQLALPDKRRGRLKREIALKGCVAIMEAHSGLTGLIVEDTVVPEKGGAKQFDGIWVSSLCDSTEKAKPDIELVDFTSRLRTIDDIMEVTTKPIIFDGDTGGKTEHFVYAVRTLERMGVSMVIVEDKKGLKKNSLFGTEVEQTQDSIEHFTRKIKAGVNVKRTSDFLICARIESLILEKGMEDALNRAFAYVGAGADAIMIHSRKETPDEVFEFLAEFRKKDKKTYIVVVPSSFDTVREEEFRDKGVNIVIYANQMLRAEFPAMKKVAEIILKNHRAKEVSDMITPIKDIIRLIPEAE